MIPATTFKGKRVALFGLGSSGLATAEALKAGGADVVAWDDNPASVAKAAERGIGTGDLAKADWSGFDAFVLSPGVPLTHPKPHWTVDLAHAAKVEIIGDVELFARERAKHAPAAPFIATTGTNGKSTTTALIAHVLKSAGRDTQLGGNIGTAVMTLDAPAADKFYVVECSSYQIDLAPSIHPTVGILLNITPDHLDRHGSLERYAAVKEQLVAKSGTAVIGMDSPASAQIAVKLHKAGHNVFPIYGEPYHEYGLFADCNSDGFFIAEVGENGADILADLHGIGSLRGWHNAQNAMAAYAALRAVGLSGAEINAGFKSFPGLAHRMEQVGRLGKVLFVNDSKATNAEAAAPALSSFPRIYWIAGGLPKEGGIDALTDYFPRVAKAYLIGEAAPQFGATIGTRAPFEISGTLAQAIEHAARDAAQDSAGEPVVLLSPACASFDQFKNFEKRGDAFRDAVMAIPGIKPMGGSV